jgi:hypothetical protein
MARRECESRGKQVIPAGPLPLGEDLGLHLKDLRLAANKRPIDVFEAGLLPVDELFEYEGGSTRPNTCVVHDLCVFYDAEGEIIDHLVALALRMTVVGRWLELIGFGLLL